MVDKINLNKVLDLLSREFKGKKFLSKVWVYREEIIVIDFTINSNRIAFNHFVDDDGKIECQVFSRNYPDSLDFFRSHYDILSNDRFLLAKNTSVKNIKNIINKFIKEYLIHTLYIDFKSGFKSDPKVSRVWAYKENVFVVDMLVGDNRIAIDTIINDDFSIATYLFSRNKPSSFSSLKDDYDYSGNKILIHKGYPDIYLLNNELNFIISRYIFKKSVLKIGVLTLSLNKNYGGVLQAFSLVTFLRKQGHYPVFINRRGLEASGQEACLYSSLGIGAFTSKFIDTHLKPFTKRFGTTEEIQGGIGNYNFDAIVSGSDQVWRAEYAKERLLNYFLDFIPEGSSIKKISYAASFGNETPKYGNAFKRVTELLKQFDAVSVREDSGVKICRETFGTEAEHVLDPTLLLTPNDYIELFSSQIGSDDKVLTYVLDVNEDKERVIAEISKSLSLKPYTTNGVEFNSQGALAQSEGDLSIESWLASFYNSKFIITDSFHGTVFAILFNKPFVAYGNKGRGLSRFTSLLKLFNLSDRLVLNANELNIDNVLSPIDWDTVNEKLAFYQEKSLSFINRALDVEAVELQLKQGNLRDKFLITQDLNQDNTYLIKAQNINNSVKYAFNITDVINRDMCIGCGACNVITDGKVSIARNDCGIYQANLKDIEELNDQEFLLANSVCPFSNLSLNENQLDIPNKEYHGLPYNDKVGRYDAVFVAKKSHENELLQSSSGGMTSWLIKKLFQENKIDAVIHVGKGKDKELFEYSISYSVDESEKNKKSAYYSISLAEVMKDIKKKKNTRFAIVGLPCMIKAARLLAEKDKENKGNILFYLGLVCGHMKSSFFAESNAWQLGINPKELASVDFRVKNQSRSANRYDFSATDQKGITKSRRSTSFVGGGWGYSGFQPNACNYCDDLFSETADVVFADAWLNEFIEDWSGTNLVISRNKQLTAIFDSGLNKKEINAKNVTVNDAIKSQAGGFRHRRDGMKIRLKNDIDRGLKVPNKRLEPSFNKASEQRVNLVLHRQKLAQLSLEYFKEAKEENDLKVFLDKINIEVELYQKLVKS